MKFVVEIEILDMDMHTNEETETTITKEQLENHLIIGFENLDLYHFGYNIQSPGYDLPNNKIPFIKGFSVK